MSLIQISNVSRTYQLNSISVEALKNVNLTVAAGEFLALAGPSGSGKTTLLNIMGCIDKPTTGEVLFDNIPTASLSNDQLSDLRAEKISFVFQNFNLFPVLTAVENVEYALFLKKMTAAQRRKEAEAALDMMGLLHLAKHKPLEMSGGQQQRVAIARAIVREPLLILADEPTANLDHKTGEEIVDLMREINRQKKTTFIFSTHDQKVIDRADRVVRIWDGEIVSA
ncbi:MAG: ABC transporter ATP-binding protein [Candidatus Omnitrophica bacterium]|nr:ABC transporter ATP-binding protein [Candidatus Omnitrophota bacterium]